MQTHRAFAGVVIIAFAGMLFVTSCIGFLTQVYGVQQTRV
jgi:hypothetical protein